MRLPDHHPLDDVLFDYANGSLPEAEALVVATHSALCPDCRSRVSDYESVGGALLEEVDPEPVSAACFESVMSGLSAEVTETAQGDGSQPTGEAFGTGTSPADAPACAGERASGEAGVAVAVDLTLPQPLRGYVGKPLDALPWKRVMTGMEAVEIDLATKGRGSRARLLKLSPGTVVPQHSHRGSELTLVLTGGFSDGTTHYERGDFASSDADVDHQPVVDSEEPCICLTVTDAPLRLTGRWTRFLNPFVRW